MQSNKQKKTFLLYNLPNCYTISLSIWLRNPLRLSPLTCQARRPTPLDLALNLASYHAEYVAGCLRSSQADTSRSRSRSRSRLAYHLAAYLPTYVTAYLPSSQTDTSRSRSSYRSRLATYSATYVAAHLPSSPANSS